MPEQGERELKSWKFESDTAVGETKKCLSAIFTTASRHLHTPLLKSPRVKRITVSRKVGTEDEQEVRSRQRFKEKPLVACV